MSSSKHTDYFFSKPCSSANLTKSVSSSDIPTLVSNLNSHWPMQHRESKPKYFSLEDEFPQNHSIASSPGSFPALNNLTHETVQNHTFPDDHNESLGISPFHEKYSPNPQIQLRPNVFKNSKSWPFKVQQTYTSMSYLPPEDFSKESNGKRHKHSFSNDSTTSSTLSSTRNRHLRKSSESSKNLDQGEIPNSLKPKIATTYWEEEGTKCYQVKARGHLVSRREDNNQINGTKLLNVTGMSRGKRDGLLKTEKVKNATVVKLGSMNLKGIWIPFERAAEIARNEGVDDLLYPLFVKDLKSFFEGLGSRLKRENQSDDEEVAENEHDLTLSLSSNSSSDPIHDRFLATQYDNSYDMLPPHYFEGHETNEHLVLPSASQLAHNSGSV